MRTHKSFAVFSTLKRLIPTLALTGSILLAIGPTAVSAGEAPSTITPEDAYARIQVAVKSIYIKDDHDWIGGNDFTIFARWFACETAEDECSADHPTKMLAFYRWETSGSSGDTVAQDRVLPFKKPANDDTVLVDMARDYDASDIAGYPLYLNHHYYVEMEIRPHDQRTTGNYGLAKLSVASNGEIDYGAKSVNTVLRDDQSKPADYDVQFEVRKMDHPDLSAVALQVYDLAGGSNKLVCATVANVGSVDAGPFEVAFHLDGDRIPNGIFLAGRLGAAQSDDACIESDLAAHYGKHELSAFADQPRGIYEENDRNNSIERPYEGPPAPPALAIADLSVPSFLVKGKQPGGQDDCDPGKDDVTVTVKNLGTKPTGPFVLRLTIDGGSGDIRERAIPGLDSGKSLDVLLQDVLFGSGTHEVVAFADAKNTVTESDRTNNRKLINVTCNNE